MLNRLFLGVILLSATAVASANDSLVRFQSNYSVQETANRFEKIASNKGITIFARVDHQKNAQNVDMELAPSEVIIFGNPKVIEFFDCIAYIQLNDKDYVLHSYRF